MSYDATEREYTPYGVWRCADGREVLFNRSYRTLCERKPGEPIRRIYNHEWVDDIVETEHFFDDATSPWSMRRTKARTRALARIVEVMHDWGMLPVRIGPGGVKSIQQH